MTRVKGQVLVLVAIFLIPAILLAALAVDASLGMAVRGSAQTRATSSQEAVMANQLAVAASSDPASSVGETVEGNLRQAGFVGTADVVAYELSEPEIRGLLMARESPMTSVEAADAAKCHRIIVVSVELEQAWTPYFGTADRESAAASAFYVHAYSTQEASRPTAPGRRYVMTFADGGNSASTCSSTSSQITSLASSGPAARGAAEQCAAAI